MFLIIQTARLFLDAKGAGMSSREALETRLPTQSIGVPPLHPTGAARRVRRLRHADGGWTGRRAPHASLARGPPRATMRASPRKKASCARISDNARQGSPLPTRRIAVTIFSSPLRWMRRPGDHAAVAFFIASSPTRAGHRAPPFAMIALRSAAGLVGWLRSRSRDGPATRRVVPLLLLADGVTIHWCCSPTPCIRSPRRS